MDAYSPEIIGTLETLIVPGKQVRISPYVEAMQFQRLFGESPDPKNRFESARSILDAKQKKVIELVEIWGDFVNGGKEFRAEIYGASFLDAYLAYYLTVNVGKLQILFLELLRQRLLPPRFSLLDVGIASGTTFIALLDFVAAWESACLLHDTGCPIESIEMIGVDAQPSCLDYSRQAVTTLADVIAASDTSGLPFTAWAKESQWIERNIGQAPLEIPENPTLFVCSNILSEGGMEGQGHATIEQAVRNLPHQSIILLLEPGDKPRSTKLNQWRARLLNDDSALHLVAPCGQEYGSRVPQHCGSCWNARRESLHRPLLYQRFCEEAEKQPQGGNPKWQIDYENHLLSWSYLCFVRNAAWQIPQTSSTPSGGILTRFIGRYRAYQTNQYRAAAESEAIPDASETIKFCPAICGDQYKALTLDRAPGFVMPPMAFGQSVHLQGVAEQYSEYVNVLKVRAESVQPCQTEAPSAFLIAYSEIVRRGIDSVTYRLFGFPGMREFQHQILERVLTGRSIFGIAATGGGKSECFILPAMLLPGLTVVISPLKSLMQDQYDQRLCARYGLDTLATFINSSISFQEKETRIRRMELGYYKLVYLTPEQCVQTRILDSLRRAGQAVGFRYLALDEAHCISHWGHDFRPAYLNLLARINQHQLQPVRIALTATASPQVRRDICDELFLDPRPLEQGGDLFVYSANRPELNLIVKFAATVQEKVADLEDRLKRLLRDNHGNRRPGAAIIFMPHTGPGEATSTNYKGERQDFSGRRTVAHFASHLERALHKRVGIYHGKMEDDAEDVPDTETPSLGQGRATALPDELGEIRDRNRRDEQERFIRGDTDIMVATKGFGMGIDKPNIRLVLHHSTPGNLEAYTQEAGRAGRDGDFADVVLYFSPQPVGDVNGQGQSDSDIQRFFLDQKYVRELDVRAIRHFLRERINQENAFHMPGRLYFTADEVISHFDQIAAKGYSWPDFPPRQPARGWESPDHRLILDRGHDYESRINLITRILSVCYEIRPLLDGHRVSLLDRVDSVGSIIKGAKIEDANAILASNDYFGELLREKGFNDQMLYDFLGGDKDLFPFAKRLGVSLKETASLLYDIRTADGHWIGSGKQRKWKSSLLNFKIIAPPKRGPARGKESLGAWREYAGATRRANTTEAKKRASKVGRDKPNTDDWFGWSELSSSKGWEVEIGAVLRKPSLFDSYRVEFLKIHEQRRDEDNRAYQLLLRDYIGVTEGGQRLPENGGCLRVVLLGYLKTNETVLGKNCGGCSICCPDEQFDLDLERRKARIVSLSEELSQHLADIEQQTTEAPSGDLLDLFWEQVERDEGAGRSVMGYLRGWTNRLISETPSHLAAFWLRVDAMLRGRFPLIEGDLLHDLDRLRELIQSPPDLNRLHGLLEQAFSHVEAHPDRFDLTKARLMQRLGRAEEESAAWISFLRHKPSPVIALEAYQRLAALFAPDGSLADLDAHRQALAGAIAIAPNQVREITSQYVGSWTLDELLLLLQRIPPEAMSALAADWFNPPEKDDAPNWLEDMFATLDQNRLADPAGAIKRAFEPLLLDQLEGISAEDDRLRSLLCRFETFVTWPTARWLHLAAQRFSAIGEPVDAKEYWETLLALPEGARPDCRNSLQTLDASRNLAHLFAADGPFPDTKRRGILIVQVLQQQPALAAEMITPDVAAWSIECVCDMLAVTPDACHEDILSVWFRTAQIDIESIFTDLETVLTEHPNLQQRPAIKFRLVSHLLTALRKYRHVLLTRHLLIDGARIRYWLERWTSADWYSSAAPASEKISIIVKGLLESAYHADARVLGRVTNQVKGGFKVDLGGVAAFLPVSEAYRLRIASTNPDQGFEFKVLDIPSNPNKDMVLSRRLLAEQRFDQLTKGQVIKGIITTVVDYGAFVDLGGIAGLLHKSRMGNQGLLTPSDFLQEGQKVVVEIIGMNRDTRNVALKLT